ncbi:hypothetical protein HDU82_006795 [Entophlyctis luteolus]|nr:hypothetical protein HDU82_006795 [Entophlyctis luteolus]
MVIPVNTSEDCFDFSECLALDTLDLASFLLPPPLPSSTALAQMLLSPDSTTSSATDSNSQMIRASDGALVPVHQLGIYECMLVLRPQSSQNHQPHAVAGTAPAMSPASTTLSSQGGCASPLALVDGYRADSSPPELSFDNLLFPPSSSPATASIDTTPAACSPPRRTSTPPFSHKSSPSPVPQTHASLTSGRVAECVNCNTRETSVWRKDEHGRTICNACGLYKKQRGYDRPAVFPFRKNVIRKRTRQPNGSARKSKQQKAEVCELNLTIGSDIDAFTNIFSL